MADGQGPARDQDAEAFRRRSGAVEPVPALTGGHDVEGVVGRIDLLGPADAVVDDDALAL